MPRIGVILGRFACLLILCVFLAVSVPACTKKNVVSRFNPDKTQRTPEEIHQEYRRMVSAKAKDEPEFFAEYVKWVMKFTDRRFFDIQQEIETTREANALRNILRGLEDLRKKTDETKDYLNKTCICNISTNHQALKAFNLRYQEYGRLFAHHDQLVRVQIRQYQQKSMENTRKGETLYAQHLLDDAYSELTEALELDRQNPKAKELLGNIQEYFEGSELLATRRLDQAEAHFNALVKKRVLPALVQDRLRELYQTKQGARAWMQQATVSLRRKNYKDCRTSLDRAFHLHAGWTEKQGGRLEAVNLAEQAWEDYRNGKYKDAAKKFKRAHELWEDRSIASWLADAELLMKREQVKLAVKDAEGWLSKGWIERSRTRFEEAAGILPKDRTAKKLLADSRKGRIRDFLKRAREAEKEKNFASAWLAYAACDAFSGDRTCAGKRAKLEKKQAKALEAAFAAVQPKTWAEALMLEAVRARRTGQEGPAWKDAFARAVARATLVLTLDAGDEGGVIEPGFLRMKEKLEWIFDDRMVRWRFAADGERDDTPGRHIRLRFTPYYRPGWQAEDGKKAAAGGKEQPEPVKDVYRIDIRFERFSESAVVAVGDSEDAAGLGAEKVESWLDNKLFASLRAAFEETRDQPEQEELDQVVLYGLLYKGADQRRSWIELARRIFKPEP